MLHSLRLLHRASLRLPLLVVILLGACTPTLRIARYEPGRIEPRGARALVLLEGEGRKEARDLAAEFVDREASGTWWRVENRSAEGVRLVKANGRIQIVGDTRLLRRDELWARIDVVQWGIDNTTVEDTNDAGETVTLPAVKADVMLQAIIADASGMVLLDEQQYRGTVVVAAGADGPLDPLVEAARVAASSLLDDISPHRVFESVRLDDSDPGQKALLERLTKSAVPLAASERGLRRYVKNHPQNAIALYNLAVVLDAEGKHDEARQRYDEAIQIVPRDFYLTARAGCAQRARARTAVFGEVDPANKMPASSPAGAPPPRPSTPPSS